MPAAGTAPVSRSGDKISSQIHSDYVYSIPLPKSTNSTPIPANFAIIQVIPPSVIHDTSQNTFTLLFD